MLAGWSDEASLLKLLWESKNFGYVILSFPASRMYCNSITCRCNFPRKYKFRNLVDRDDVHNATLSSQPAGEFFTNFDMKMPTCPRVKAEICPIGIRDYKTHYEICLASE